MGTKFFIAIGVFSVELLACQVSIGYFRYIKIQLDSEA